MREWLKASIEDAAWVPLLVLGVWALCDSLGVYRAVPWFDKPTHLMGGVAICYFFYGCASRAQRWIGEIPEAAMAVLCIGLTALAAIGWEFYEFAMDALFSTRLNNGVADTLGDLFCGVAGGAWYAARAVTAPLPSLRTRLSSPASRAR